jgi:hypothetical protein
MPMLFVNCHKCGQPFPSGIAPVDANRPNLELLGVLERCPHCGDLTKYMTHEFFAPKLPETGVADAPSDAMAPA